MQGLKNTKFTRKKLLTLFLLGLALIATMLLAGGLSRLEFLPGRPFPVAGFLQMLAEATIQLPRGFSLPSGVVNLLAGCLWLVLFISIIAFIISPQVRKDVLKRLIIYLIWFLLLFGLIRTLQPYLRLPEPEPQGPADSAPPGMQDPAGLMPTPPDFIVDPPQWLVIAASILLIAAPLIIAWLVWRFFAIKKHQDSPLEMLTQEAQRALEELQAGGDLKDTVMRCYWEMGQILGNQRNLHRQKGMTAREFEQYLAQSGLKNEHIQRLTRLFESVRYGSKPPGPPDQEAAITCLAAIVQTYGQPS